MKNNAMLKAGKTIPTIGTKIEGRNAAVIFNYKKFFGKYLSTYKIDNINCIQKNVKIKH
jgi:hypothetical protein